MSFDFGHGSITNLPNGKTSVKCRCTCVGGLRRYIWNYRHPPTAEPCPVSPPCPICPRCSDPPPPTGLYQTIAIMGCLLFIGHYCCQKAQAWYKKNPIGFWHTLHSKITSNETRIHFQDEARRSPGHFWLPSPTHVYNMSDAGLFARQAPAFFITSASSMSACIMLGVASSGSTSVSESSWSSLAICHMWEKWKWQKNQHVVHVSTL